MSKDLKHTVNRRGFLFGSMAAGAGVFAAGVLGLLGSSSLGFARSATAFASEEGPRGARHERPRLEQYPLSEISRAGVKTRLGIVSDAHLCTYDDTALNKLTNALETMAWVTPGIDAFFMLGDATLSGLDDELDHFAVSTAESLTTYFSTESLTPIMHVLMGNHDWWNCTQTRFETAFAHHASARYFDAQQNSVALLDGTTIIKLNGTGSYEKDLMDYTEAYDFLADALEEASVNRPGDAILVMSHEPPDYMELPEDLEHGNYGQDTNLNMVALMQAYPQVRMFSGHIHNPLDMPETINDDLGFTSVHTSTVGSCLFVRGDLVDDEEQGSQGLVLDILDDGTLLLHRLDFANQCYLGDAVSL